MLISELLTEAKKLYLKNIGKVGMCWCIKVVANEGKSREEQRDIGHIPYACIKAQIPEFNPFYLKSYKVQYFAINQQLSVGLEFWWDINDSESRIKAFDELIELYKNYDKEFIW